MKNFLKMSISALTAVLLLAGCASDSSAPAAGKAAALPAMTDAEVANKFKGGSWTGDWSVGQYGGKFVLNVTGTDGNKVTGEALFFGTQAGDTKEPLGNGVVEKGQLSATLPSGMAIKLRLRDEKSIRGTWLIQGIQGDLKATR